MDDNEIDQHIENNIIMAMMVSTAYLQRVAGLWRNDYLETTAARTAATWIWAHYEQYGEAPGDYMRQLWASRAKYSGLDAEQLEFVAEALEAASDYFGRGEHFNAQYMADETRRYFRTRRLQQHYGELQALAGAGRVDEAEAEAMSFAGVSDGEDPLRGDLLLGTDKADERIAEAFSDDAEGVIRLPGAIGKLMNRQLTRDAFVAFLAPEKRGKSHVLLDLAMRGARQGSNVAFFQAGDMTERQQLMRICTYIARRPPEGRFDGGEVEYPVKDCIYNQTDQCDLDERCNDFGVFPQANPEELRERVRHADLQAARREHPDYNPCHNCAAYCHNDWGTPWLASRHVEPMPAAVAQQTHRKWFGRYGARMRLATYPSQTLTISEIRGMLRRWEREEHFVPNVVCIDYADLLVTDNQDEYRHRQNEIWQGLRGLSSERRCLVLSATQADARSYGQHRLSMSNFSEDKRKFAHVTAMYGLNRDADNREYDLGLLRINEIVVREGGSDAAREATLLQSLTLGRPLLTSYW